MKLINAGIELATLFQRYARKVLMREGEGIMKIPSKKKVNDFAENIYQDFKSSGVPNNVIKTEKDIGKFHKQITDIEEKARKKWWDNQLKKPPELADIFDLQGNQIRDTSKIMGGKEIQGTPQEKINWLVKNVDPNAEQTIPPKATLEAMLKDGREDLIDHFFEMHTKELGKPKINIDTSGLKHPELVKKMMMDKKLKPTLVEKLDPALYEDRGGNIIPAQFGIHPNSEIAKSLRLEAEAAKKLKNMSEAEIKLRGNRPYDTDEQILNKLNKGNKESIERLKNKPLDPDVVLPNYNETPGAYSRRKTPGSKENLLQELKIAYEKEFNRLRGDETAEELKEILKNLDTDGVPFAAGGRAGLYQGGQAQIEPDLSGIGHGSDALMARNMLIAPGSQATTSTGLNYLLGEDNDTTRVPYNEGNMVLPKPKAMDEYLLQQVMSQAGANTLDVRTREMFIEELKKKIRDKRATEEKRYQFEELRDQGAEDMYYDNREKELDIKYNPQNYPPSRRKFEKGGRVPMWFGGALTAGKALTREMLKFMAKGSSHGKSPAEMLKLVNPKQIEKFLNDPSLPLKFNKDTGIMASDMVKDMIKKTKTDRTDMIEQLLSSARNIKKGDDNLLTYKNQIIEEMVSKGMDRKTAKDFTETLSESLLKEVGPKKGFPKITEQGLIELETIQKNLLTKDRQLNAGGGLAGLLGEGPGSTDHGPRTNYKEAGVVDKIGGMVNYKNVPHYLAKPLKGVTNIAEWMGRLPFATAELASDIIRKPLFKPGDRVPGLPGVGAKFVGGEMFEKFGNNMTPGALAEKLGLTALADKTGENLTDEARTVGDILESLGEFAPTINVGGILAAGKNLFKGGDSLKKLSQSIGKVKDNKTLEKLVDETLTARGEGRRDFNKLVASGGLMVALQSIGLGGIKAAKTKAAPDAVFTLKTLIDDSDVMTENGLMAVERSGSIIDISGLTDAVKKSLAVIMKNRKNQFGEKVVRNKVKGKEGKFTDDYDYIPTEDAAYIMEELQKKGHNIKFDHYDNMGGQGVDDILDKFKNNDFYKGTKLGKENYDKFSKKVAKMTDKEKFAYHTSITDDAGQYYDEFVEELLDMNFKNSTK